MLRVVLAISLAFAMWLPARAQTDTIKGVISSQIEAFQTDDLGRAFSFASPAIKGMSKFNSKRLSRPVPFALFRAIFDVVPNPLPLFAPREGAPAGDAGFPGEVWLFMGQNRLHSDDRLSRTRHSDHLR